MKYLITLVVSLILTNAIALAEDVVKPAEMSKSDIAGGIYLRPDMTRVTHPDGSNALDVTNFTSSDGKYETGMYASAASNIEINQPWGVDEFFYVVSGSITLTSDDGSVMVIEAGETATIPKEWTGKWDTEGYSKIWVIYTNE